MEKEETNPVAVPVQMSAEVDNEPEPRSSHIKHSIQDGLYSLGKSILGFVLDIFLSLWSIVKLVGRFFATLGKNLRKFCLNIGHMWRYNDVYGKISFFVFGVSSIKHGQIVNGVLYLLFEVGFILGLALNGIPYLSMFFAPKIGQDASQVCHIEEDPILGKTEICETVNNANSVIVMIFSILWLIGIAFFLFMWLRAIKSGYNNYRIAHFVEFDKRTKAASEASKRIYDDMEETGLFQGASVEALKVRYKEQYDSVDAVEESPMDKMWGKYVLDNTITESRRQHKELFDLRAQKVKLDRKAEAYDANARYKAKQDIAEGRFQILMGEYNSWMTLADEADRDGNKSKADNYRLTARKVRIKALDVQNAAVNRRSRHNKKHEEICAKSRLVQSKIVELEKTSSYFAQVLDVKNYNTYGKFNDFYLHKQDLREQKLFYENFGNIIAEYQRGLDEYEKANEENLEIRKGIEEKHTKDLADIEEKYAGIEKRRSDLEAGYAEEKAKFQNGQISKEEYLDHCKTIKGKVLSLPSKKDVRASKKEDIKNANHAYHRDFTGIKVNYTDKEYAAYCASNYMIVELDFPFELAKKFMKEVLNPEMNPVLAESKARDIEVEIENYEASYPEKFVGKPKSFKNQLKSMANENFHITLLALPVLGVVVFVLMPLVLSIIVGFTNWDYTVGPVTGLAVSWIGFDNFGSVFGLNTGNPEMVGKAMAMMLIWTLVWAVLATFTNYFIGIIYALMINKKGIKFKGFWRFVFVLSIAIPQFISLIAIGLMLKENGALDRFWFDMTGQGLGFAKEGITSEGQIIGTKAIIVLVNIWVGVPYTILQTSGILLNIPEDLYESSSIDGAGPGTQFFKITLPYILFVTGPSLIQTFIGNINNFGIIYFLTGGGPNYSISGASVNIGYTDLFITYIYKLVTSTGQERYGVASAVGIMVFILCAFISMIMYNRSSSISQEDQFA